MLQVAVLSGDDFGHKSTAIIRKFDWVRLIGISAGHNELTEKMLQFQADKMLQTAQAVYFDQFRHRFDLFRMAIRNRKHLFCNSIPDFNIVELKQLLNLMHEAGSTIQIMAPAVFHKQNLRLFNRIRAPFLANIRVSSTLDNNFDRQLLHMLLLIVFLDKSEFRKVDLMSIPAPQGLVEIRLVFTSGSVARLLFSNQLKESESEIEIFQDGASVIQLQNPSINPESIQACEENAFNHFIRHIQGNTAVTIGLQQIIQAKHIKQAIQSRLNLSGNFFDKKRHAV